MGDHEGHGVDFEKKADQKLSGWGLFGNKYEEAADLLDRAGSFFKLAKNCETPVPPFASFGNLASVCFC
jgi:alpha-soluble NSF attachment protein